MHKKVLITGGAGFIGSHLADFFIKKGIKVVILDNLSTGKKEYLNKKAKFIYGDITNIKTCRMACAGVNAVFHLAAMSKVAPSINRFSFCTNQNIKGTLNILNASRELNVQKVIYSASSTYYGNSSAPQIESMLPDCLNPYAVSKYVGEQFCEVFTKLYGLPTVSLRYFNVYGPRQPSTGPYALVLGIFLKQAWQNKPLTIHGNGLQRRDFINVKDVVTANLAAWKSPVSCTALNVGSGKNISIRELAYHISTEIRYTPSRKGDAKETLADITKTKKLLNWKPIHNILDDLEKGKLSKENI